MNSVFIVWYRGEVEGKTVTMMWGVYRFIADAQAAQAIAIGEYEYPAWITEEIVH